LQEVLILATHASAWQVNILTVVVHWSASPRGERYPGTFCGRTDYFSGLSQAVLTMTALPAASLSLSHGEEERGQAALLIRLPVIKTPWLSPEIIRFAATNCAVYLCSPWVSLTNDHHFQ